MDLFSQELLPAIEVGEGWTLKMEDSQPSELQEHLKNNMRNEFDLHERN